MNIDLDSLKKKVKPKRCEADIFRDGFRHFLQSGDYSDLTLECEVHHTHHRTHHAPHAPPHAPPPHHTHTHTTEWC
jgi:hypothetical protein